MRMKLVSAKIATVLAITGIWVVFTANRASWDSRDSALASLTSTVYPPASAVEMLSSVKPGATPGLLSPLKQVG